MSSLSDLPIGARIRRFTGETGTLLYVNGARARVRLDGAKRTTFETADGRVISFARPRVIDVAPDAEYEFLGEIDADTHDPHAREVAA